MLAYVFTEAHHLRSACLAGNVEPGHLDSSGGARFIDHRPHGFYDDRALVFGNAENFRLRAVESSRRAGGPVFGTAGVSTHRINRADLFHEMRHIHLAAHSYR